jgi:hypothetical protein
MSWDQLLRQLISGYNWWNRRPRQALCQRVWPRVQFLRGEAPGKFKCALFDVRSTRFQVFAVLLLLFRE